MKSWPMFRIDTAGEPQLLGRLHALERDRYWFDAPLGSFPTLSDGLPFFLRDLIPQGFVGRSVPRRCPELALPERISDWNDGHVLTWLCQRGEDCVGDLVLGDESLGRLLKRFDDGAPGLDASERHREYPKLALAALEGALPGSIAGGEHPKFTTSIRQGCAARHVLVKFSPDGGDRVARRWADLLVSEHVATEVLHEAGLSASTTELRVAGGRTFLEVTRFDRKGGRGRSGLISLAALANEYSGGCDNWITACAQLARSGVISRADAESVRRLATFGRLIANTDMHFGNLSFHLSFEGPPALAPIYDMLPMMYAPTSAGLVPAGDFEPPLPSAGNRDIWNGIAMLAQGYWNRLASHDSISAEFSAIARRNAERVAAAAKLFPPSG
jgi:hypothetical protein